MNEVAINAAQVSVGALLAQWGAAAPHDKAREIVNDLLRRGWIPPDEATPTPGRLKRGEFTPSDPIPSEQAKARIAALRQIVRDNPAPAPKEAP